GVPPVSPHAVAPRRHRTTTRPGNAARIGRHAATFRHRCPAARHDVVKGSIVLCEVHYLLGCIELLLENRHAARRPSRSLASRVQRSRAAAPSGRGPGRAAFRRRAPPCSFGVGYGTTVTCIGSSAAPGAGKPITGTNGDDDVGDGTQKVAAKTAMPPLT